MKSLLVICALLAVGSVECGRRKRFAFFGPPKAAAAPPAAAAPSPMAATGMDAALAPMGDELDKENALGGPVNTAGLNKATLLTQKIELMGSDVDKDKLDELTADFVLESTDFSGFMDSAKKPADTAAPAARR